LPSACYPLAAAEEYSVEWGSKAETVRTWHCELYFNSDFGGEEFMSLPTTSSGAWNGLGTRR
jgi:hypothetical protein